jgi:hypothetical protein
MLPPPPKLFPSSKQLAAVAQLIQVESSLSPEPQTMVAEANESSPGKKRPRRPRTPPPAADRSSAVYAVGSECTLMDRILVNRAAGDRAFDSGAFADAARAYDRSLALCGPKGEGSMRASLHYNKAVAVLCQLRRGDDASTTSTSSGGDGNISRNSNTRAGGPQLEVACAALAAAAAVEPQWPEPHLLLGHARHAQQPEQAMRHFHAALRAGHCAKPLRVRLPNGALISNQRGAVEVGVQAVEAADLLRVYAAPYHVPPVVPHEWCVKESRSKRGRVFFMHRLTLETRWVLPHEKPVRFIPGVSSVRW